MDFKRLQGDGWFYSKEYSHFQKVNNEVYAYVRPLLYGWMAQLYKRGTAIMCDCEVRTSDSSETGFKRMKDIAEEWLEKYGDNYEGCYKDYFHISNPHGAWGDTSKKAFWLKDTI